MMANFLQVQPVGHGLRVTKQDRQVPGIPCLLQLSRTLGRHAATDVGHVLTQSLPQSIEVMFEVVGHEDGRTLQLLDEVG